ncbi:MAG: 4-(cytidine 5'-diphospho)-2-C-methyl-D-erythritol kinase [Candidatus Firestonebacteria bacterium]
MDKITLRSPAKINLFLKITGKRPDGYHNISTIFQTVSLYDEIIIEKNDSGLTVDCDNKEIPSGQENLAFKAASLTFRACGASFGAAISIRKKIPVLAGLGGGSGNAAAVIVGIDRLYGLNLPENIKEEIAAKCGADVPFLLKGGTALGEGVGEKLKHLKPVEDVYFVLVNPGQKKPSTKEIYAGFRMRLTNNPPWDNNIESFLKKENKTGGDIAGILFNDLEPITDRLIPAVSVIKKSLLSLGALGAMMTGSGPTVFGVYGTEEAAKRAAVKLKDMYNWVYISKSCSADLNEEENQWRSPK